MKIGPKTRPDLTEFPTGAGACGFLEVVHILSKIDAHYFAHNWSQDGGQGHQWADWGSLVKRAMQLGTTHTFKLQNKERKYSKTVPSKALSFSDQLEKRTHVSRDATVWGPVLPVCSEDPDWTRGCGLPWLLPQGVLTASWWGEAMSHHHAHHNHNYQ